MRTTDELAGFGMYRVFNAGAIRCVGSGYRHLLVRLGRKNVTVLDYVTLAACQVPVRVWHNLHPESIAFDHNLIKNLIRAKMKGRERIAPAARIIAFSK